MNIREEITNTLLKIHQKGAFSNLETQKFLKENDISFEDQRLYLNIVYGTLQHQLTLNYIIGKHINKSIFKLDPEVLETLRVATYQLFYLEKIPEYAIVNEAVKYISRRKKSAKSFVNGVLRSMIRENHNLKDILNNLPNSIDSLEVKYGVPKEIIMNYFEVFGKEKATKILPKLSEKAPFTIRVNTLKTDGETLIRKLKEIGYVSRMGKLSKNAIIIENINEFNGILSASLFREGYFTIQDQGAMLAVERLNPLPGDCILDMCSAPGGKTTYMSQLMKNSGEITARDIYINRLDLVQEAAIRLGCTNITIENKDGVTFNENEFEKYDKILIDAPCSGYGVIRRKPEIKYTTINNDNSPLVKIQENLLVNGIHYLKLGGRLVYSTCTVTLEENENQINKIVRTYPNIKIEKTMEISDNRYTSPLIDECDCFFMCSLIKTKNL